MESLYILSLANSGSTSSPSPSVTRFVKFTNATSATRSTISASEKCCFSASASTLASFVGVWVIFSAYRSAAFSLGLKMDCSGFLSACQSSGVSPARFDEARWCFSQYWQLLMMDTRM